jgi:4-amino-4-deoxy-L-arabinose transferase-like glycosyltransferase
MAVEGGEVPDTAALGSDATSLSPRTRAVGLGAIVLVSLGAHLWGLVRDLPMPDVDERYFVTPAAYIAASGDLNPHWFGHPGSTVIYPLAFAFRLREVVFHGAPLLGTAPSIATRLQTDAASFYLMGRLWAVLFGLASLPLLFAIGRRVFGDLVALLATGLWALVPLGVQYGQVTRTDAIGLYFALLTIWACLRALDQPSAARFVVAGAAAGLGVASRYFLAALAVLLCTTWWFAVHRSGVGGTRHAGRSLRPSLLAGALGTMVATFMITTPYFLLDWRDALSSMTGEAAPPAASPSSNFLANLTYYATSALPHQLSWIGLIAAAGGLGLALRRPTPARVILCLWVLCAITIISVLSLHWARWVIPAIPILALFAAYASVIAAGAATARFSRTRPHRWTFAAVLATLVAVMAVSPASGLLALDRSESETSTRVRAESWIEHHIRHGSGVAVELKGPDLTNGNYRYVEHYSLPDAGTVTDYARDGYRYVVVNTTIAHSFMIHPHRFRAQAAFYEFLRDDARRLAQFDPAHDEAGPHLALYDLGPSRNLRQRDRTSDAARELVTLRSTSPNRVPDGDSPVPFAHRELGRLEQHARGSTRTMKMR